MTRRANADRSRRADRTSPRSAGHLVALGSPFLETRAAQGIRGPDSSPIRVVSESTPQAFPYLSPEGPGSSAHYNGNLAIGLGLSLIGFDDADDLFCVRLQLGRIPFSLRKQRRCQND